MAKLRSIHDPPRPGRKPAITKEMLPAIERLAALGLSEHAISKRLGMHPAVLSRHKNGEVNSEVSQALQKGALAAIEEAATDVQTHAKKNALAAIFRAKVLLGRDDPAWAQIERKEISGTVDVNVKHQYVDAGVSQPVIDVTPETSE